MVGNIPCIEGHNNEIIAVQKILKKNTLSIDTFMDKP